MSKYGDYVNKTLKAAMTVYFSMRSHNLSKSLNPDEMYIFNGRFAAFASGAAGGSGIRDQCEGA